METIIDAAIALIRDTDTLLTIEAWDLAGNQTSREVILRLETNLNVEVLAPPENAELIASGDSLNVDVSVRVSGMTDSDQVKAQIDGIDPQLLERSGDLARGTVTVPATDGDPGHRDTALPAADTFARSRVGRRSSNRLPRPINREITR